MRIKVREEFQRVGKLATPNMGYRAGSVSASELRKKAAAMAAHSSAAKEIGDQYLQDTEAIIEAAGQHGWSLGYSTEYGLHGRPAAKWVVVKSYPERDLFVTLYARYSEGKPGTYTLEASGEEGLCQDKEAPKYKIEAKDIQVLLDQVDEVFEEVIEWDRAEAKAENDLEARLEQMGYTIVSAEVGTFDLELKLKGEAVFHMRLQGPGDGVWIGTSADKEWGFDTLEEALDVLEGLVDASRAELLQTLQAQGYKGVKMDWR